MRHLIVGTTCLCAGGLYGWSALIAPLQAAFGVTVAQTGLVFSLAIACFTLAVVATPHLTLPRAPFHRLAAFSFGGALCLGLAALAPGYVGFVACFSLGFGAFSGAVYIAALDFAASRDRHAQATPLMVACFGIGGAVFGPVWRVMAAAGWGLAALWPLAACLLICGCVAGATRSDDRPRRPADPQRSPGPRSDTVASGVFAVLWLILALGSFGGLMVLGLAAKMMGAANASVALSAATLAGVALGNTLGRASVAGLARVWAPVTSVLVSASLGVSGAAIALVPGGPVLLALGLCLIALGYGVLASAVPFLTRTLYGPRRFQRSYAFVFSAWGLAGLTAPWLGGAIYDATGSFDRAIGIALVCMSATGGVAMASRRRLTAGA